MSRCHARMALRQFADALADARQAERLDPDNAQARSLKVQVRKAQAVAQGASPLVVDSDGSEDAFSAFDTPKGSPALAPKKLCMVCMDAERECRLRPCMHAALCVECAENLQARSYGCPICNTKIESVERGSFTRTFTVDEAQGIVAAGIKASPSAASPGKSPLGLARRFSGVGGSGAQAVAGAAAAATAGGGYAYSQDSSRLEHIQEGDEEAEAAAHERELRNQAAGSRGSSGEAATVLLPGEVGDEGAAGGGGGGVGTPPQGGSRGGSLSASRRGSLRAAEGASPGCGVEGELLVPGPAPGAAAGAPVSGESEQSAGAAEVAEELRLSSGLDGGSVYGDDGHSSLGVVGSLADMGVLSPGASAAMATSLADWISTHENTPAASTSSHGSGSGVAAAAAAAAVRAGSNISIGGRGTSRMASVSGPVAEGLMVVQVVVVQAGGGGGGGVGRRPGSCRAAAVVQR